MPFYSYYTELNEDGSVAYTFATKTQTIYRVYFYPAKDYSAYIASYKFLSAYGYVCGITKVEPHELKNEPFDSAIKTTVKLIVADFIKEFGEESILLYHCDYHDGKQEKRNNLFRAWYLEFGEGISMLMEDASITVLNESGVPIITNYLGFFIANSNPNKTDIFIEFHNVKEDLIKEK